MFDVADIFAHEVANDGRGNLPDQIRGEHKSPV
jgi:hypothetical protein